MASPKEKQQINRLLDTITTLQNFNFNLERSNVLLSSTFCQVNEVLVELYLFLDPQNDLGVSYDNIFDNLDSLIVAIKKLIHENESFERQNQCLRKLCRGN